MRSKGVHFESPHFPRGVWIAGGGGSLTMVKCTATLRPRHSTEPLFEYYSVEVAQDASLTMEDCRIFGSYNDGVRCDGEMQATRCTVEEHTADGVLVYGKKASAKLVDRVVNHAFIARLRSFRRLRERVLARLLARRGRLLRATSRRRRVHVARLRQVGVRRARQSGR